MSKDLKSPAGHMPDLDPQACDGHPVIMVVSGDLHDLERLGAYAAAIRSSGLYDQLGGYYMNYSQPIAVFEGAPPRNRSTLMVRFPCLAHARAFWYSRQYQHEIKPMRLEPPAGDFTVTVYAERELPDALKTWASPGGYVERPGRSPVMDIPLTDEYY